MSTISNIDAIIELVMREARARKGFHLATRAYTILREINVKLEEILNSYETEERRKKDDEKEAEWSKGM